MDIRAIPGDLDIWLKPEPANLTKLMLALRAFGFGELGITESDLSAPNAVIQLGYPPARIDLLSSLDGMTFAECQSRTQTVRLAGIDLPIIGIDDFRKNKLLVGRPQDLADVASLDQIDTRK